MKTYFAALARFSRFLAERGMPRTQRAIRREHVDLDESVAIVLGTGRRPRACPFGNKTAQALDRYLRLRLAHPHAKRTELWLSLRGVLTDSGVLQGLRRRGHALRGGHEGHHRPHPVAPGYGAGVWSLPAQVPDDHRPLTAALAAPSAAANRLA